MSKSRRFELVEGASSKFWSIEIEALLRFERFERFATSASPAGSKTRMRSSRWWSSTRAR